MALETLRGRPGGDVALDCGVSLGLWGSLVPGPQGDGQWVSLRSVRPYTSAPSPHVGGMAQ